MRAPLAGLVGLGVGLAASALLATPPSRPAVQVECQPCARPSAVAHLERAVEVLARRQAEAVEAFSLVAVDCVVPGAWLDVGVVPVRDVVRASALTGRPVGD